MPQAERPTDLIVLEQHFRQECSPCYDRNNGDGLEVVVDRGEERRPLVLQVFPDTQVAHVSTPLTDVTLRHARVAVNEQNDVLELHGTTDEEWARVLVHRDGMMILASLAEHERQLGETGLAGVEISKEAATGGKEEIPERVADERPAKAKKSRKNSSAAEAPNRIEQERITLLGRVGTEPRFRTTKNDVLVCNFPLAVHDEAGSTTWHDIVAFNERAVKLQDSLHKGQEVEVVGYVHRQTVKGKGGQPKEKREVWAAVVKKSKE